MSKLKVRRAAHREAAEVLWRHLKTTDLDPEMRVELQTIREAHFAAGTISDDVLETHEVWNNMEHAFGGEHRCGACGKELTDKTQTFCNDCKGRPA